MTTLPPLPPILERVVARIPERLNRIVFSIFNVCDDEEVIAALIFGILVASFLVWA